MYKQVVQYNINLYNIFVRMLVHNKHLLNINWFL